MHPETRVLRWREIAGITLQQFNGDLDQILALDYGKAKKALKQVPQHRRPRRGEDPDVLRQGRRLAS